MMLLRLFIVSVIALLVATTAVNATTRQGVLDASSDTSAKKTQHALQRVKRRRVVDTVGHRRARHTMGISAAETWEVVQQNVNLLLSKNTKFTGEFVAQSGLAPMLWGCRPDNKDKKQEFPLNDIDIWHHPKDADVSWIGQLTGWSVAEHDSGYELLESRLSEQDDGFTREMDVRDGDIGWGKAQTRLNDNHDMHIDTGIKMANGKNFFVLSCKGTMIQKAALLEKTPCQRGHLYQKASDCETDDKSLSPQALEAKQASIEAGTRKKAQDREDVKCITNLKKKEAGCTAEYWRKITGAKNPDTKA